jgi:hypothetical protein
MWVNFYRTTQHKILGDRHLEIRRRQKLKSDIIYHNLTCNPEGEESMFFRFTGIEIQVHMASHPKYHWRFYRRENHRSHQYTCPSTAEK